MNKICDWLYIGKYRDTLNTYLLETYQVKAMLQLAEPVEQSGITSLYLPIEDAIFLPEALLRRGTDFVKTHQAQGHVILVACGAGISRSTAFAVAALKEIDGITLAEAFKIVRQKHAQAMPHPVIWASLCTYYNEDVPFINLFT